jgi:hypothetical protein
MKCSDSRSSNSNGTLRRTLNCTLYGMSGLTLGNFHGPTRLRPGSLSPCHVIREHVDAAPPDGVAQILFANVQRQAQKPNQIETKSLELEYVVGR